MANPFEKEWDKGDNDKNEAQKNNLEGDLGPKCTVCSGLGTIMRPFVPGNHDLPRGGTVKCERCEGSGVEPLSPKEQRDFLKAVKEMR